jgi:ferredoxin
MGCIVARAPDRPCRALCASANCAQQLSGLCGCLPTYRLEHDDDGLSLDSDACDHCGQCVAACPHEALSIPEPAPHVVDRSLILACERVAGSRAPAVGIVACLHALSADWVIQQARHHHCDRVQLASADCSACDRAPRRPRSGSALATRGPAAGLVCSAPGAHIANTVDGTDFRGTRARIWHGGGFLAAFLAPRPSTSSPPDDSVR